MPLIRKTEYRDEGEEKKKHWFFKIFEKSYISWRRELSRVIASARIKTLQYACPFWKTGKSKESFPTDFGQHFSSGYTTSIIPVIHFSPFYGSWTKLLMYSIFCFFIRVTSEYNRWNTKKQENNLFHQEHKNWPWYWLICFLILSILSTSLF